MSDTSVPVAVLIGSIVKHFESLPDPRHQRNRRHLLVDVMTLAVCGVIVGCSGPSANALWARAEKDWLKEVLALPNGIPSYGVPIPPNTKRAQVATNPPHNAATHFA